MFYLLEEEKHYIVITETEARDYIEEWSGTIEGDKQFSTWLNNNYTATDIYYQCNDSDFFDELDDKFIDCVLAEDSCPNITPVDLSQDTLNEILTLHDRIQAVDFSDCLDLPELTVTEEGE